LLQLPYRGKEVNVDFVPYDEGEAPPDLGRRSLHYEFASKGKVRSIEFPGKLWQAICAAYIPLRRQRAALYRQRTGISPPNSVLFLNEAGYAVTYQMLYREFAKIPFLAAKALDVKFKGRRFTACMIRHSCATYFVYEALKQKGRLGQHFVYDAALDEELRKLMGHKDIKTTLEYYVHLVNRFVHDDLLVDLKRAQVDSCLSALLEHHDYGGS
jgi:site-specific recombinase XerD